MKQTNRVGNEQGVSLEIPSPRSGRAISPLLFGHNFEITRRSCWQELEARLIALGKTAGQASSDNEARRDKRKSRPLDSNSPLRTPRE